MPTSLACHVDRVHALNGIIAEHNAKISALHELVKETMASTHDVRHDHELEKEESSVADADDS
jgi:hypothetical protein